MSNAYWCRIFFTPNPHQNVFTQQIKVIFSCRHTHLVPMTATNKNYKYIISVIDAYTKFTGIYPAKTLTTGEILDKLILQQQAFSAPEKIITDCNAFTSNDFSRKLKR